MANPHTIVSEIVEAIRPHLAGHSPDIQGAVLADLVALWIAGHQGPDGIIDKIRDEILAAHIAAVRALIPVNDAFLRNRK